MMLFLFTLAARAECDATDLSPALDRAEAAYTAADRSELVGAMKTARATLDCASPDALTAARILRGNALVMALDNNWTAAEEELRASIAAHPLLPLPAALVRDQRLHLAWQRAQEAPILWHLDEKMLVNGTMTSLHPDTRLLGNGPKHGSPRAGVRIASIGVAAVAAGLYGAAWGSRFQYDTAVDAGRADDALGHYKRTNALSIASGTTLAAGVGLFAVSFAL